MLLVAVSAVLTRGKSCHGPHRRLLVPSVPEPPLSISKRSLWLFPDCLHTCTFVQIWQKHLSALRLSLTVCTVNGKELAAMKGWVGVDGRGIERLVAGEDGVEMSSTLENTVKAGCG